MSKIICVTNRHLCGEDIIARIRALTLAEEDIRPRAIILREKDLHPAEYRKLAVAALAVCREQGVTCILHSFVDVARDLECSALHLPMAALKELSEDQRAAFQVLGASCHSVEEAMQAEELGCTYITAGHVFATDCKQGLAGRGLDFLARICRSVSLPVYAIGGITPDNLPAVLAAGAAGACVMSGAMTCPDPAVYLSRFKE